MIRPPPLALMIALGGALSGCAPGFTQYTPALIARGELILRYDDGFEISAAGKTVARGPHYSGLESFVRCVPDARRHARAAEDAGTSGTAFSVAGGVLAVGGLGGLSGLAFKDKNPSLMAGLLVSGIVTELLGLSFALAGRIYKIEAPGHAVDAVNYYNDAVGSLGGSCSDPAPAAPR